MCRARNKAIEIASGEYILPLDAGDTIEPSYVEKVIDVFNENPNIGVVYSRVKNFTGNSPCAGFSNPMYNNTRMRRGKRGVLLP